METKHLTDDEAEKKFRALMVAGLVQEAIDFMLGHMQNKGTVEKLPDGGWRLTARGRRQARDIGDASREFVEKHSGNLRKAYLDQFLPKRGIGDA